MKHQSSGARLSVVTAMVIFGTIGIVRSYVPSVPSGLLAALRGVVGALFLLALLYVRGGRLDTSAIRKNLGRLIVSGVLIGFNWMLLFEAYRYTSVATATLCYYMAPVFVILASPLVTGERLTARKLVCTGVALAGMIPVSGVLNADFGGLGELRGVALGLGAAVLYACVVLMNQRIKDIGAYDKTILQLGAAGLSVLPYALIAERVTDMTLTLPSAVLVGLLCIVHTGLAYALYFGAMGRVSAQTIALLSYIDPVVAVFLSAALLGQGLDALGWLGALLVLGATVVCELPTGKDKRGASLKLRRAVPSQYGEIVSLYEAAIRWLEGEGINIYWDLDSHPSRAFLRRAIEKGELYVAVQQGRVVGAAVIDASERPEYAEIAWSCNPKPDRIAVMHVLAVLPEAHGRGVGRFMLRRLARLCRKRGIRSLRLDALTCNAPACELYRRAGFLPVERRTMYVPNVGEHEFEIFELVL